MILAIKERTDQPLSFIASLSGYINQLVETLEHHHKLFKKIKSLDANDISDALAYVTKNSRTMLLCREQLHNWKQKAQTQVQQQQIAKLEQKLSQATRLNSKLYDLIKRYEKL
jgi:hypothetical protein